MVSFELKILVRFPSSSCFHQDLERVVTMGKKDMFQKDKPNVRLKLFVSDCVFYAQIVKKCKTAKTITKDPCLDQTSDNVYH